MSLVASSPRASVAQVVAGVVTSLVALATAQMACFIAYIDVWARPGGMGSQTVDELGRPLNGWSQVWENYGELLWVVYALGLLVVGVRMWRTIFAHPPRAGWGGVVLLLALSAGFWAVMLNAGRFYL